MLIHFSLLSNCRFSSGIAVALALSWSDPISAQSNLLFEPPAAALSIHSRDQGLVYGRAHRSAAWHVSQWNNPLGDVPDFTDGHASNEALAIDVREAPLEFTITQDSKALRCEDDGVPREFDGLIGTNTKKNNNLLPTAEIPENLGRTVNDLRTLLQHISLRVRFAKKLDVACKESKAVSLVAVVFDNIANRSTLFLQIILYSFNTFPNEIWWAVGKNGRFGYNIVYRPSEFGNDQIKYSEDLLPRLKNLIETNKVGMDPDLGNWKVSGAYFGNAVYGHVALSTIWSRYGLEAEPRK